ncbi:MAG: protein kinase [Deltaproteobacteria bacterium]|nr:protein kinase [Deltaproteobacteria bacterium]
MSQQQQRYRVIEKLASGGMAEVFRAESAGIEGFKKKVAIKRVLGHLSKKQKFISMFLDEARLSAHLSHSNVVQVFDIGMGDNTYFIVMEFVDGADLKAIAENCRKNKREFPLESAVYIATKICEGLSYAHELTDQDGRPFGIVHRDVSPPNVLITKFGEVKIADFGLAKANNQLEKSEPGIIKGKFSYLSPEAATGQEVDSRTDIFAVGIILWELLAGRKLFQGESDYQTVQQVINAKVPSLHSINPRIPAELDTVMRKALARESSERYLTAREFARDLTSLLFKLGIPVGPFDIASLVTETQQARLREKPAGPSIIDKLIEEALFEFTSLRGSDAGGEGSSDGRPSPLVGGMHDWASEIKIKNPYDRSRPQGSALDQSIPAQVFEEGNLAALEDDEPGALGTPIPASPPRSAPVSSMQGYPPPSSSTGPRSAPAPESRPMPASGPHGAGQLSAIAEEAPAKKSGAGMTILIIALLVMAAGAAGAWYTGVIPH